ncbi:MAG: hypothetical protein SGBAC_012895 [Bacillariaceae sp.]
MPRLHKAILIAVAFASSTLQLAAFSVQKNHGHQTSSFKAVGLCPKTRQDLKFSNRYPLQIPAAYSSATKSATTVTTATTTRLYSASAENQQGNHFRPPVPNGSVNGSVNGNAINGAAAKSKGTIPLSTNQGIFFGCVLAVTSGIINGATLMGLFANSQGTAALTGTYTKSAMFLAKGEMQTCLWYLRCLLCWMAGSSIVGLLVPEPSAFEVKYPKGLATSLAIGAACLSVAGLKGGKGGAAFGPTFVLLCLMAQGIQDAVSSVMTGNLCRTTHMTGITCDLGTYLGQWIRGNRDISSTKVRAFSWITVSFSAGAFLSWPLSQIFGARMLLGVAGAYLSVAASIGVYFLRQRLSA